MKQFFEQGPIRPPSEAGSLLLRFTRNCPWNKCGFCRVYKNRTFSRRSLEEIKCDIDTVREIIDALKKLSEDKGHNGRLNREVLQLALTSPDFNEQERYVAAWACRGQGTVFIQDANSLIMKQDELIEALHYLRERVPGVTRVTCYARSNTVSRKSVEELQAVYEAGLDRVHIGMESGSDKVLKLIRKGASSTQHIEAGQKVRQSGLTLSEYVMPGLGGRDLSKDHALETARVLNSIDPHYIRLRTLRVIPGTDLHELWTNNEFQLLSDDETAREIRLFIEHLEGIHSTLTSDHIMNLLEEVQGTFPQDKQHMLDVIDEYLGLPELDRLLYRLGRRGGALRSPREIQNPNVRSKLERAKQELEQEQGKELEDIITEMGNQYI